MDATAPLQTPWTWGEGDQGRLSFMGERKSHLHPNWGQGGRLTQPQTSLALLQTQSNKPEEGVGNPQCMDKTEAQRG